MSTSVVAHHIVSNASFRDPILGAVKSIVKPKDNQVVHNVFHIITLVLFIPLTIVLNVLVLLSVSLVRRLHTPHDVMVAACSLMDLLVGLVYLPIDVLFYNRTFYASTRDHCEFIYMSTVFFSLSLTTYVLMSVERWLGVKFPFWYHSNITCWRVVMVVGVVHCIEIVLEVFLIKMVMQYDETLSASDRCDVHNNFPVWYNCLFEPIFISTKLIISLTLCVHVNVVARKHRRFIRRNTPASLEFSTKQEHLPFMERHSCIPIVCTFLFIILWVPKLVVDNLPHNALDYEREVNAVLESLLVSNSFINPLLICFMKRLYLNSFKTILSTYPWQMRNLGHILRVATNLSEISNTSTSNQQRLSRQSKTPALPDEKKGTTSPTIENGTDCLKENKRDLNINPVIENLNVDQVPFNAL